jgi:hypothetical protein
VALGSAGFRVKVLKGGCGQGSVFVYHIFARFEDKLRRHLWAASDCVVVRFTGGADVLDVRAFDVTVHSVHVVRGVSDSVVWVVAFTALVGGVVVGDVYTQGHAIVDTGM